MKKRLALLLALAFYVSILPPLSSAAVIKGNFSDIITKGPWVDVRAYGAVGDATTDDAAAIQAAIDAAIALNGTNKRGGVVFFPPGQYLINTALTINGASDITLAGAGGHASAIRIGGNISAISLTGIFKNITIRDLWIGSFAVRSGDTWGISATGTGATNAYELSILNVTVQNTRNGVQFDNVDRVKIDGLMVLNSFASGMGTGISFKRTQGAYANKVLVFSTNGNFGGDTLTIDSDCDTVEFVNSSFSQAGAHGVHLKHTLGGSTTEPRLTKFVNVSSESNLGEGWYIEDARTLGITDCEAAANTGSGFNVSGGKGITINGSKAIENGTHGFNISGGRGVSILGVQASNNGDGTHSGIFINNDNVSVMGSHSGAIVYTSTTQKYGLTIVNGKDNNVVIGNIFHNNATAPVQNAGTAYHNIIAWNVPASANFNTTVEVNATPPAGSAANNGRIVITGNDNTVTFYSNDLRYKVQGVAY